MALSDELGKLQRLRESGALTEEEFAKAKAALLEAPPSASVSIDAGGPATLDPRTLEQQTRQWAMFLHLSLLAGFVVPMAGLVAPIVIWQIKKEELPGIDAHGKMVANWIISAIIYSAVCFVLVFVVIGVPLLIVLGILAIVFPVIGAIKANNGELWKYPLSLTFLK